MSERRIPEQVTYVCDGCGKESEKKFDTEITITRTARDFQGAAVGGHTTKKDLCDSCITKFNDFFDAALQDNER